MRIPEGFTGLNDEPVKLRVRCVIDGCNCTVSVLDYGIMPMVMHGNEYLNLFESVFFCRNHWPEFRRQRRHDFSRYRSGSAFDHIVRK